MKIRYAKPLIFPLWAKLQTVNPNSNRYKLCGDAIVTDFPTEKLPYSNHIEISGFYSSLILSYRINEKGQTEFYRLCIFPSLRIYPNDTRGSLAFRFPDNKIKINGKSEVAKSFSFNGIPTFISECGGYNVKREFFPGNEKKAVVERISVNATENANISLKAKNAKKTINKIFNASDENYNLYTTVFTEQEENQKVFYIAHSAEIITLDDVKAEISNRENFITGSKKRLNIVTPDEALNRMLEFTKIRASESIFQTKNGLMHAPGGGNYYAALWTNDQCEYANPYFAYLGYDKANEQSLNCYRLYSKIAKKDKAIYTSIVAEGDDYWHGAGDRGDSSMYIYGFSRYLLTTGDRENAVKYLSSLETACEYIMSKMNKDCVIESDSDELENRFESGSANLSTAVISYDAFISMSYIEKELGNNEKAKLYEDFADKIKNGIKSYFETNVEGFETYRYCKEESRLRSWICLPMTVGITNRVDGTVKALKSDKLKKASGLLTKSGEKTYWDRSLLYALRGMIYAGRTNDAFEMLSEYTSTRLLGEHIPYPVEAFPEGNAAHLSAESALYQRIFTEGFLGFRPIGFNSFNLKINLPDNWETFKVENFNYGKNTFNILITRKNDEVIVEIPELKYSNSVKMNMEFSVDLLNA